jgi:hypothetical protein
LLLLDGCIEVLEIYTLNALLRVPLITLRFLFFLILAYTNLRTELSSYFTCKTKGKVKSRRKGKTLVLPSRGDE